MEFLAAFFASILSLQSATFSLNPQYQSALVMPAAVALTDIHPGEATVLFAGDMMFDRSVRITMEQKGGDHIFSCIDSTLESADLVVANLEGPITGNNSKSVGSVVGSPQNFVFTFPLSVAPLLAAHHVDVVSLGNNHILNFGASGVRTTRAVLDVVGVRHFGDPLTDDTANVNVLGVPLTFISYNEFGGSASTTIQQIKSARAAGNLPVVYTHWGIEYRPTAPQYIRNLAHQFVDAGASIVIGSHPHVVEDSEFYNGVYIYYSLGNFIFDQYWDESVRNGLLLQVGFDLNGVTSVKEIPVVLGRDRRTCPAK